MCRTLTSIINCFIFDKIGPFVLPATSFMIMNHSIYTFVSLALIVNLFLFSDGNADVLGKDSSVKQPDNTRSNVICKKFTRKPQRAACNRAFRQINIQLTQAAISIENATVALQYKNGTDFKIQGWCTSSTFVLNQNIILKVNGGVNIPLSANILTDTYRINMIVPTILSGKFSVRHRLGMPSFRECRYFYKDDFIMFGSSNITIRMKGEFGVRTSFKETDSNYIVRIRPIETLGFSIINDVDISWKYSGLNKVVVYLIRNVRTFVNRLLRRTMRTAMKEEDDSIKLRLQTTVEDGFRKALKTNGDGVRIITIPKV